MEPQSAKKKRKDDRDETVEQTGGASSSSSSSSAQPPNYPEYLGLTVQTSLLSLDQSFLALPNQQGPRTPAKQSSGSSTTSGIVTSQTDTSPSISSSHPSFGTQSDDSQEQTPRPAAPNLQGDCRFVDERGQWEKAHFLLFGAFLKLYSLKVNPVCLATEKAVFGQDVINRGLVGSAATDSIKDRTKWPPEIPAGCEASTLLLFLGGKSPNLWLVFPTEPVFLSFYGYWKERLCEIKDPRGRKLLQSFQLYEEMRARNNI